MIFDWFWDNLKNLPFEIERFETRHLRQSHWKTFWDNLLHHHYGHDLSWSFNAATLANCIRCFSSLARLCLKLFIRIFQAIDDKNTKFAWSWNSSNTKCIGNVRYELEVLKIAWTLTFVLEIQLEMRHSCLKLSLNKVFVLDFELQAQFTCFNASI